MYKWVCLEFVPAYVFFSLFYYRGFCYFNSIAIAAKQLRLQLKLQKVLIVDWVSPCGMFTCARNLNPT